MATRVPNKGRAGNNPRRNPPTRGGYGSGSGSGSVTKHAMHENANQLGPWIVAAFVGILGMVLHAFATNAWSTVGMVVLILVSTAGLIYSTWTTSGHRPAVARWHSVITAGLTGGWLALCTVTGMLHLHGSGLFGLGLVGFTTASYLVCGATLAGAWNHRISVHTADMAAPEVEPELTPWGEAGFKDVRTVKEKKINEYRTEGTIMLRGATLDQLQNNARRIEVEQNWPRNSLTMVEARGLTARRVDYAVMHADPLADPIPWPGLDLTAKQTLLDPIKRGLRGDGEVSTLHVAFPQGTQHKLVVGTNGSGKTAGEVPLILTTAALGAVNILIDPMKPLQSYGDIAGAFKLFVTNPGMAQALLERIITHVVRARSEHLARERLKAWSPKSTLKLVRLQLEEVSFLEDIHLVEQIAKIARSVGIEIDVSLQRCTFDQMPTTLRDQLPTVCHYGILTPADAKLALPEEVIDAGAQPARWRSDQPGMHYVVQKGIPLEKQIIGVRAWDDPADPRHNNVSSPNGFARVADNIGRDPQPMCEVTAKALGDLWTNRIDPMDMVRRDLAVGPVTGQALANLTADPDPLVTTAGNGGPTDIGDDDMTAATATDPNAVDGIALEYSDDGTRLVLPGMPGMSPKVIDLGENPDPSIAPNPWGPLPGLAPEQHAKRIGQTSDPDAVPPEEFNTAMRARLDELIATCDLITAKDFLVVVGACKWSRPSIYDRLDKWAEDGLIKKLHTGKGWVPIRDRVR